MSNIQYTPEQEQALSTRNIGVALDAGAGCGKTFVLTERYLSHLDPKIDEDHAKLDEIIAITFTDAAAREMRDRIRTRCRDRLLSATGKEAKHWRGILETIDMARVSTIHSLCASLIRQCAVELGIDPAFRVLDPAEATILRSQTLDETLSRKLLLTAGQPDPELVQVAAELSVRHLKEALEMLASQDGQSAFDTWIDRSPEEVLEAWLHFYQQRVLPVYIQELTTKQEFELFGHLLGTTTPVTPGFAEVIAELQQALVDLKQTDTAERGFEILKEILPRLGATRRGDKITYKVADFPDKEIKKQFTTAKNGLSKVIAGQRYLTSTDDLVRNAELGLYLQKLAVDVRKDYRNRKLSEGVLDNDDLMRETQRLLTSPEFRSEQKRIASGIRVLMVDEFQDTNQLQVDIVRALVESVSKEDALDGQSEPEGGLADGRLFFVGDYKQSIYRFRQAEPDVFRRLQASTPEAGRLPLSMNFRSQPAVIDFVNALFSRVFGDGYQALKASKKQIVPSPSVEFLWTPIGRGTRSKTRLDKHTRLTSESRTIARRIRELIDKADPIISDENSGKARAAKPGDFVMLFRAHSDVVYYEEALREAGLEYYVVGGKAFYAQQETYDLFNVLRAVESSCDDIALAGALRSPFFGLLDETLFWLTRDGSLNRNLFASNPPTEIDSTQKIVVGHAAKVLIHLRKIKNEVSIADLIAQLLEATNYDATLLVEFLGNRKLANMEKLIEQARICDASGGNLCAFLVQLKEFINKPPTEGDAATSASDADVVRLMTIHSSKGLEFPIVVLPDLNRQAKASNPCAAYHPELGPVIRPSGERDKKTDKRAFGIDLFNAIEKIEDRRERERLFYVACTRAADRLIFSGAFEEEKFAKMSYSQGSMLDIISKHFDVETGKLLRVDDLVQKQLVEIPDPPTELKKKSSKQRSQISKVITKVQSKAKRHEPLPALVASVVPDQNELLTFSISRLTGEIQRDYLASEHSNVIYEASSNAIELGTLIHAVLERVNLSADLNTQLSEASNWVSSLTPNFVYRNRSMVAEEAKGILHGFLRSEHWQWFSTADEVYREVEILLPWHTGDASDPNAIFRGYIDALVQDDADGWHIVDYKTNQVAEPDVGTLAVKYRFQLGVYALALESAKGISPHTLKLFFLRSGLKYEFAWNDKLRAEIIKEINEAIKRVRTS